MQNMNVRGQVDAISTGFSKAFDRIDQNIFLRKIVNAGICESLFWWFSSW